MLQDKAWMLAASLLVASCASSAPTRTFEVENRFDVQVPAGTGNLQMWMAMPDRRDEFQSISDWNVESPYATRVVEDDRGNQFLYLEAQAPSGDFSVVTSFTVEREEVMVSVDPNDTRALTDADRAAMDRWLAADAHIPTGGRYAAIAEEVVGDETNPLRAARKIYDWELEHVDYWVKDPEHKKSSGVGSADYCYDECTGNCTDFHSLYASVARSAGLPTKITYGSFFKGPLDGQDQDQSYHCWIDFWAPEIGWVPLDVAVADVFVGDFELSDVNRSKVELTVADGYQGRDPETVDYYFGNLDARRVSWHEGRDLRLEPSAASEPINALPKAHVEIDGVAVKEGAGWTRKLTFTELH